MKKLVDTVEEFCLKILEKIGLKKLADWYRKHQEGMRYLVFGALATLVNIVVYSICYYPLHISNAISNGIAWIVAAIFAYITNKFCVFNSKVETKKALLYEICSFFGCRLLTLAIDEAIMILTVDTLGWNGLLMKIVANIVVIILNFIFSKLIIFTKGNQKGNKNENPKENKKEKQDENPNENKNEKQDENPNENKNEKQNEK